MNEIFDIEAWRQVIVNSLTELGTNVARFLPSLVGTVVLLAVGWIVSKVAEKVARRALLEVGLDRVASRTRVAETLRRAGVEAALSTIFARLLFWMLMLAFLLSAVEALGLSAVTSTIDRLIAFLPDVFAATLIVLLGLMLGKLARNVVSSGAAAANFPRAQRIGAAAGSLIVLVVFVLALEQLGIDTGLLVTVLAVVLATAGLTVGVSLALGARPLVTHILAGHFLRQSLPKGTNVDVLGHKGSVELVGPLETRIRDGERVYSIPNATLIEETVLH